MSINFGPPLRVCDELVLGKHESKGLNHAANGGKDQEGRFIALEFDKFWVVHTYVPNAGGKLKRLDFRTNQWDKAILREMKAMETTKPGNRRSAGFTDEERKSFSEILDSGFVDTFRHLHSNKVEYSYFGYRHNMRAMNKAWRLDYLVVSKALLPNVEMHESYWWLTLFYCYMLLLQRSSFIRESVEGSDHLPIGLELEGFS
ncbi:hypothetical protein PsorP6_002623 [Peronosclerospora sorghi]|uniref:Uncharacterized protein n=1 Tax=Peronosclerospora sorghi TaxID=230839 RepID=A0ACC0WV54_9STRA|nr:hypothetical protein PsorP6_002623 [Peronosclerospora sorghi]